MSDTAVWLAEAKSQSNRGLSKIGPPAAIPHRTIQALRQIGLLADIMLTKGGVVVYPSVLDAENRNERAAPYRLPEGEI